jgi:hypothetical protein
MKQLSKQIIEGMVWVLLNDFSEIYSDIWGQRETEQKDLEKLQLDYEKSEEKVYPGEQSDSTAE